MMEAMRQDDTKRRRRVLLFGTHPKQVNGYCQVVYHLAREMALDADAGLEVGVYGFQNFVDQVVHANDARQLPPCVTVYDACAAERERFGGEVRELGFFFSGVADYLDAFRPDVVVVYNDMVVVSRVITEFSKAKTCDLANLKVIVYVDQVYPFLKKQFVSFLNQHAHHVITFTPYWQKVLVHQGLTVPTSFLRHGFDPLTYYPVPKELARKFLGIDPKEFVVLNMNRNQPRKRWDTCLQAYAEFISRHVDEPIKMIIATTLTGGWNLMEVFEFELKKRGLNLADCMRFLVLLDRPLALSDFDVNLLYNVADVGINTCDGEGFGLCNFQQAALGVPQVVPRLGGFLDFFTSDRAQLIEPVLSYHVDASRDDVGGEAWFCDFKAFADALDAYYMDPAMRNEHGRRCASFIPQNYRWSDIGAKMGRLINDMLLVPELPPPPPAPRRLSNPSLLDAIVEEGDEQAASGISTTSSRCTHDETRNTKSRGGSSSTNNNTNLKKKKKKASQRVAAGEVATATATATATANGGKANIKRLMRRRLESA